MPPSSAGEVRIRRSRVRRLRAAAARQAAQAPTRLAVVDPEEKWTYAQLDRRANQLAHHLIDRGVSTDQPVGVCLERSCDLVVALVANPLILSMIMKRSRKDGQITAGRQLR